MSQPGAKLRVGTLPQEERMAIIEGARKLGLNPYEFGGFLSLESGPNMDPNIVGGAGKKHRGLIQFGENEQKQYGIVGSQTRAGQMPAVLQYFKDRGFKPGMNIERAYATVLGGNPNVSLTAKDSFGTSVASASKRFKKGGDLYENAQRVLGDLPPPAPVLPSASSTAAVATPREQGNSLGAGLLNLIKNTRLGTIFQPQSSLPGYDEILNTIPDPQSYLQAFANRLMEEEEV